jgi:hypothetical protein
VFTDALVRRVRALLHVVESAPAATDLSTWRAGYVGAARDVSRVGVLVREHPRGPVFIG